MPTGPRETAPSEFLRTDQAAYEEAAARAREAAREAEARRSYPQQRRALRRWVTRRLGRPA